MNRLLVIRLGLIRFATSILVVLLAGVLNRIMIAELKVAATLVTTIFSVQHFVSPVGIISGHLSDTRPIWGYRRMPYILGGMLLAAVVMPLFPFTARHLAESGASLTAIGINIFLFGCFGLGVTVSATVVNALIVDEIETEERGSAMTTVWIMTLAGFLVGSAIFLKVIPKYDYKLLIDVFTWSPLAVLGVTVFSLWGIEKKKGAPAVPSAKRMKLFSAYRTLVKNPVMKIFFLFLALSNFSFFLQEYVLEAYGGEVLGFEVFETTGFNFYWSYGVIAGMAGISALLYIIERLDGKKILAVSCLAGAFSFVILAVSAAFSVEAVASNAVLMMGLAKGIYNVGLSHMTMSLVDENGSGFFMGVWNFIAGLAIALGEMMGGPIKDLFSAVTGHLGIGYAGVFLIQAAGLLLCLYFLRKIGEEPCIGEFDGQKTGTFQTP